MASDSTGKTQYAYASVAQSADGDFVVTWSQLGATTSNWDVYAQWYTATGAPMPTYNNPTGAAFRVNSTVANVQRYSTVSMDNQGDAVIVWQSLGQDGDGYGVYMQRYNPAGIPLGGTDQVELLTFTGNPVGTFTLQWGSARPAQSPTTAMRRRSPARSKVRWTASGCQSRSRRSRPRRSSSRSSGRTPPSRSRRSIWPARR